ALVGVRSPPGVLRGTGDGEAAEPADSAEPAERAEFAERAERDVRRGAEPAEAAESAEGPEAPERCRMPRPRPDSGSGIAAVRVPVGGAPPARGRGEAPPVPPEPAPGWTRFSPVQSWSATLVTGMAPVLKRGSTPRWIASRICETAEAERGRFACALASIIITSRRRS